MFFLLNLLGSLAGDPLKDSRVTVVIEDVINIINNNTSAFDAILLDVDNGPDSLTQEGNDELYSMSGVSMIHRALRPGGVVAVWSSSPDTGFIQRLNRSSFHVLEKKVRGRTHKKGPVHTIWIATKSC
jgi:spermidine synthase